MIIQWYAVKRVSGATQAAENKNTSSQAQLKNHKQQTNLDSLTKFSIQILEIN